MDVQILTHPTTTLAHPSTTLSHASNTFSVIFKFSTKSIKNVLLKSKYKFSKSTRFNSNSPLKFSVLGDTLKVSDSVSYTQYRENLSD